jgi:hypothetical protein
MAKHDSTVWLRTLRARVESGQEEQATYVRAFPLALALCNAPPAPLDLIAESFEVIYLKAEKDQLRDNEWMIVEPFVPELNWLKNWDNCERIGLRLRSSLSGLDRTSLNCSQAPNWSQFRRLRQRKERTWRKRVGVEPTIRPAKDRITGFEGRESHRTLFASGNSIA